MTERADAGRSGDAGSETSHGEAPDIGGSTSGGDRRDANPIGDGQATRKGENPISHEEAQGVDAGAHGTPDDLAYGTRRTVGLDEDEGAGMPDGTGAAGD
jgi:hypothetical protein